jgi:hypothetical protein
MGQPVERCTSVGCTAEVEHMESLASGIPKPWCCQHYEAIIRLKQAIAERQHLATIELLELQITFMREILRKNGVVLDYP